MQPVLETAATGQGGPLVLTARSRVVVDASVTVFKGTTAYDKIGDVTCTVAYGAEGQPQTATGATSRVTLPSVADTGPGAGEANPAINAMVPVGAVLILDPGRYDFSVTCQNTSTTVPAAKVATATARFGTLSVIASGL